MQRTCRQTAIRSWCASPEAPCLTAPVNAAVLVCMQVLRDMTSILGLRSEAFIACVPALAGLPKGLCGLPVSEKGMDTGTVASVWLWAAYRSLQCAAKVLWQSLWGIKDGAHEVVASRFARLTLARHEGEATAQ